MGYKMRYARSYNLMQTANICGATLFLSSCTHVVEPEIDRIIKRYLNFLKYALPWEETMTTIGNQEKKNVARLHLTPWGQRGREASLWP